MYIIRSQIQLLIDSSIGDCFYTLSIRGAKFNWNLCAVSWLWSAEVLQSLGISLDLT